MALAVNQQSSEIAELAKAWPMLEALQQGTDAMRAGGPKYLPQWPNEEEKSYRARIATATLFPAYRRTVSVMSGKPFAKALTLSEGTPASIRTWSENIDLQGVNLHAFAAEMFAESFFGLAGILVDYPDTTVRDENGQPVAQQPVRTVAEVQAAGIRPYWVRVRHNQILGWRAQLIGGVMQLTQLRLLEAVEEDDGEFGTKSVQQVRVLEPGRWRVFRKVSEAGGGESWVVFREGTTTLAKIPFVPLYGRRAGFMIGHPPLIDLAYLNVKHWQSQSDQDTIEHVARVPILVLSGADDETSLTVGAQCAVKIPQGATLAFCEHTGAAIDAGAKSLVALEDQMIQTGAELLVKKPGDRSATEAAGDQEANKSDLQRMVEGYEDAIDQALQFTADWVGQASGGNATLFKDFGAANLSEASAQLVLSIQQGGLITKTTAIKELQRRGELDGDLDPETELEAVEMEGPALGEIVDNSPPATPPKKRTRLTRDANGDLVATEE